MNTREIHIQGLRAKLEEVAYQYSKTGFLEHYLAYNVVSDQLLSMGVKPEHLPMITKREILK